MFIWFEIEYVVLDNGYLYVYEFYRIKLIVYVKFLKKFML